MKIRTCSLYLKLMIICMSFSIIGPIIGPAFGSNLTGDEILGKIDDVLSAPSDSTGIGIMVLVDKKGKKKERRLKMWSRYFKDKDDWSLTKFIEPSEVRNMGFLSLADDKMYLYLPAFDRVRRIASHSRKESFAGSDLSNDDLSTGGYRDNYTTKIIKETDGQYVLSLIRKKGSSRIYPSITAWVDKRNFTIIKSELMDETNTLWKTLEAKHEQIQGYWTMTETAITDVRKDHKTILTVKDVKFDTGLEDKIFSRRYLKRRIKNE